MVFMRNYNRAKVIEHDSNVLLSVPDAVQKYQQAEGHLQDPHKVVIDPVNAMKWKTGKPAFSER